MKALAPDHLADLQNSGLRIETIARCEFESVRPHDIPLKGVESAYRLPYFDIGGKKNCLERIKLFPPVKRKDSTQKYHQAPDSKPSLYLPPLVEWARLATDPQSPVIVTEGEKKAACLTQQGLPCIGVAGVWNWRQSLDSGEKMVLPALDQFVWTGRRVELVPDSDVWRADKFQALSGFYALAQELVSRGAVVWFIVLPEGGQGKVGVDDWMLARGGDWGNQWEHLTRIRLDDARLHEVAGWWQGWREKHATTKALVRDDTQLTLTQELDVYLVRSEPYDVVLEFSRVALVRGAPQAELAVTQGRRELCSTIDILLKSEDKQTKIAKTLHNLSELVPWRVLIPRACSLVLKASRDEGLPMITISKDSVAEPLSYAVYPLVYNKKTTVLYGDGGLGKSTICLLIGMAVSVGYPILGMRCPQQRVLYLDYEDDDSTHINRMHAIQEGHPELLEARFEYIRLVEPLHCHTHDILKKLAATKCGFIVLDSILCATGGDSSAEAATTLNLAFRKLNCSILAVGHVAKGSSEQSSGPKTVYGSVYFQNLARSTFEAATHQEIGEHTAEIALTHRKHNLSRAHPSIGIRVTQDEHTTYIHYELCNLEDVPELSQALPLWKRIYKLMESSAPLFEEDIVKALGAPRSAVSGSLSRYRGKHFVQTDQGKGSAWTKYGDGQ